MGKSPRECGARPAKVTRVAFHPKALVLAIGCEDGCQARAECSASRAVGGTDGIKVGDEITTVSWCLTHTGVKP